MSRSAGGVSLKADTCSCCLFSSAETYLNRNGESFGSVWNLQVQSDALMFRRQQKMVGLRSPDQQSAGKQHRQDGAEDRQHTHRQVTSRRTCSRQTGRQTDRSYLVQVFGHSEVRGHRVQGSLVSLNLSRSDLQRHGS